MAKYFLLIRPLSRGKGARATRAAAYRAGERIRDERTGQVYNFSDRGDVVYKEIVFPSQVAASADMSWAQDRSMLWNAAERAGHQRNSRVAREVLVILPPELTPTQRTNLVRRFSRTLSDKYRNAVDVTIHVPRPGADERHNHAHLLMTTREVTAHGLGPRTTIELGGEERQARGLGPARNEYLWVREQWAQITNEALHEAGIAARIDHRSFKDQGVDREPTAAFPQKIYYAERRSGRSTQAGDDIRARHRERVEARLKGPEALAQVLQRQKQEARQRAVERSKQPADVTKKIPHGALTRQELSRRRLEWHHANKERVNQRRRELYKANAKVVLQKQRAWRHANAQKINERRRQWRNTNAEKLRQQARERRAIAREQRQPAAKIASESTLANQNANALGQSLSSTTAEESAKAWREYRKHRTPAPTAEESARKWREYTKHRTPAPTAEESARKWREYRERQKQAKHLQAPSEQRSDQRGLGKDADDRDDQDKKNERSFNDDYGL